MLFKKSKTTKELMELAIFNIVYVAMWLLVTYSNYFEIVSAVTFLDLRTRVISGMSLFETVLL